MDKNLEKIEDAPLKARKKREKTKGGSLQGEIIVSNSQDISAG